MQDLGTTHNDLRVGNYEVGLGGISDFVDEPDLQFIGFISAEKSSLNYGQYIDRVLDELYGKQSMAMDPEERKKLCHQFQKRTLDEMTYTIVLPWLQRIVLHSPRLKGFGPCPAISSIRI